MTDLRLQVINASFHAPLGAPLGAANATVGCEEAPPCCRKNATCSPACSPQGPCVRTRGFASGTEVLVNYTSGATCVRWGNGLTVSTPGRDKEDGCAAAVALTPIPNVTSSFCDDSVDYQVEASGASAGSNFSYRVCMDVASASSSMDCTQGVPCPGGPDLAHSVFTNGTLYSVDHSGKCVATACPSCAPPLGMPFSFLLIDGANGDTSRGVAKYVGTAEIDGANMDHFSHDRGAVQKGAGVMNWYLVGNSLMRNSYVQASGASGNRDFSGKLKVGGTRVEPAPASSFDIPKGCSPADPADTAVLFKSVDSAFGDNFLGN